jgi:periplasmic copper chaperone A
MSRTSKLAAATAVAALAVPAAAQAHVTVQPNQAAAGAFTVLNVRVPTELDNASTAKVDVKFPDGFAAARYQNVPGWKVRIVTKKLAQPIQTDDGPITEGVDRMVFARTSPGGGIKPGQFQDFPVSVQIPGKAGDKLTFKAIQTYSNGDVVRWIGGPAADEPAPQVTVTPATPPAGAPATAARPGAAPTAQTAAASEGDGGTNGLSIAALAIGLVGLVFGAGALAATRRRRTVDSAGASA